MNDKIAIACMLFLFLSLVGLDIISNVKIERLEDKIQVYEERVIPGLINNANAWRKSEGLKPVDFYNYISDYTIYTEPIGGK